MTTSAPAAGSAHAFLSVQWRRRLSIAQDVFLTLFFAYTAYLHWNAFASEGLDRLPSLFFGIEQTLLFGIYITRRRSYGTTPRFYDWFIAAVGGWAIYLARPGDAPSDVAMLVGTGIQCAGLVLTVYAIGYLGKSFGIVAANRGLKVTGPYRIVRHPVYFAHTVSSIGFVIASFTPWNLAVVAVVTIFQLLRINAEERWLTQTTGYAEYRQRTRWRLLPGIY